MCTKAIDIKPGMEIIDIGTGGGFLGVPLAIFFPDVQFHLVDSIGKKLKVIDAICSELEIKNISGRIYNTECRTLVSRINPNVYTPGMMIPVKIDPQNELNVIIDNSPNTSLSDGIAAHPIGNTKNNLFDLIKYLQKMCDLLN